MSLSAISGFAEGFAGARADRKAQEERKANSARQDRMMDLMEKNPQMFMGGGGGYGAMGAIDGPPQGESGGYGSASGGSGNAGGLFGLIDKTEGGGNYSTLFGHAQNGGRFNGVDVSKMTIGQLKQFASPNGEYGQWVKGQVGHVATPMGRHQIVGTTLFRNAEAMGLSDDTVFTPQLQDTMADRLARNRLAAGKTPAGKRAQLRAEWDGFRGVSDSALDSAIAQYEAQGQQVQPRAMGAF
jgi:hypothetical protein